MYCRARFSCGPAILPFLQLGLFFNLAFLSIWPFFVHLLPLLNLIFSWTNCNLKPEIVLMPEVLKPKVLKMVLNRYLNKWYFNQRLDLSLLKPNGNLFLTCTLVRKKLKVYLLILCITFSRLLYAKKYK